MTDRQRVHTRTYVFEGFYRSDGLWDIEGRLRDVRTVPAQSDGQVPDDEPLHDMSIRLTIDQDLVIQDLVATIDVSPYRICPTATEPMTALKGLTIGPGWRRQLRERLGGVHGCTHHVEMLDAIATVAIQTLYDVTKVAEETSGRMPRELDGCYALARDGEVVKRLYPAYYTGD